MSRNSQRAVSTNLAVSPGDGSRSDPPRKSADTDACRNEGERASKRAAANNPKETIRTAASSRGGVNWFTAPRTTAAATMTAQHRTMV